MRILALISALFALNASAGTMPSTDAQYSPGLSATKNYVKNPGCDTNVSNITQSVAGKVTRNTTTPLEGAADCKVDSAADDETNDWTATSIEPVLNGKQCEAAFTYKGDGSLYKAAVLQAGSVTTAYATLVNTGTNAQDVSIPFTCDSTRTVALRLEATGDGAAINLKRVYVGQLKSPPSAYVSQAEMYGSLNYTKTTNCTWSSNATTYTNYSADTDCASPTVVGNATAPGTKIPGVVFSSLPAGEYEVKVNGVFVNAAGDDCNWRISDGTTSFGLTSTNNAATSIYSSLLQGRIKYNTAQTNVTFQVQVMGSNTPTCNINAGVYDWDLTISVYRYPLSSQQVVTPDMTPAYAAVKWAPTAAKYDDTTSATYETLSSTDFNGSKTYFGTATSESTNDVRLTVPGIPAGRYSIKFTGPMAAIFSSTYTQCDWAITDGTSIIASGKAQAMATATRDFIGSISGPVEYTTAQGAKSFSLQARRLSGSGTCDLTLAATGDVMSFELIPLTQSLPMPAIVGTYNKQFDITTTSSLAGWSTVRSVGRVYQTTDGTWRITLNVRGTVDSGAHTANTLTFSGLVFKNVTGYYQVCAATNDAALFSHTYTDPNTATVVVNHASATTTAYSVSCDVELESRPTFAN